MTAGDSAVIELMDSQILTLEQLTRQGRSSSPSPSSSSTSQSVAVQSRRQAPRIEVQRPVVAFPVTPDGAIDMQVRYEGTVVDASAGGIGLQLNIPLDSTATHLIVGITLPDGNLLFQGVERRHIQRVGPESVFLGARYGGPAQNILGAPLISPRFDPMLMQYRMPFTPAVLANWIRAGVLRPRLLDRVQVCPRCDTLASFRLGCRSCRSGRIERERLIHHFCCAHVDRVVAFEHGNQMRCPKCQRWPLVVGADFDYQTGLAVCLDCGWKDSEAIQIGHCFRCGLRFPAEQAKQQDLIAYDVLRLDPLALLAPS